ncbi:MAG: CU044_2847 family protein [Pseudonocardiaceae bacterium]
MAYLVEVPMGGGATVSVAVREVDEGVVRAARPGQVVARTSRTLDEMVAGLRPVAETFVAQFRSMVDAPDEFSVQFGITLSAGADLVIASTAAEANFAVTLNWTSKR